MITQERLKELLHYNPKTGVFRWRCNKGCAAAGDIAGAYGPSSGYWRIKIDKRLYLLHRLAWLYEHGTLPRYVDHRDTDKTNNRLSNLRAASQSQNSANAPAPANNTSGHKGVTQDKRTGNWVVRVKLQYVEHWGGTYKRYEDACKAQEQLEKELQGGYAYAAG